MSDWLIRARDADLRRQAEVDHFTQLEMVLRFNRPGTFVLQGLDPASEAADVLGPGGGIIVRPPTGGVLFSGPVDEPHRQWGVGQDHRRASGRDDTAHLWDRLALPQPLTGNLTAVEADVRTGVAETVLHGYVDDNAGPSALAARRATGLVVAPDTGLGTTVTGRGRFQPLGDLLAELALAGGDLGFQVRQSEDADEIEFAVYQPQDRTGTAVFSPLLGNLTGYSYSERLGGTNHVIVGGAGTGTARVFVERDEPASQTRWSRRVETFLDFRGSSVTAELEQAGDETLLSQGDSTVIEVTPIETAAVAFGVDYNLGDRVTVVVDGVAVEQVVREVRITLTREEGAQLTPVVVPLVGTPGAEPNSLFADLFGRVRQVGRRVGTVERR